MILNLDSNVTFIIPVADAFGSVAGQYLRH